MEAATAGNPEHQWMSFLTLEWVLKALVQPYADHPDFRPEWRL